MIGSPLDIDPVAEAGDIVALWNACAGDEFPMDKRLFIQQLRLDTDPRRCLAFKDSGGLVVAAILAKRASRPGPSGRAPATGAISVLAVDAAHRRNGMGSALLEQAKRWLSSLGATKLWLGSDYYHFMPGRPIAAGAGYDALEAFAVARGFEGDGDEYDLVADISKVDAAEKSIRPLDGDRYRIRAFQADDEARLLDFMARNFPGRWTSDLKEALAAGMRAIDLIVVIDGSDGSIVGFSRIYDADSTILGPGVYWRAIMGPSPGALGPIGIDASKRGSGLGMRLLRYCVRELRSRGVGTMVIDWTDLTDFYGKMGFTVWKRYELMSAEMQPRSTSRP